MGSDGLPEKAVILKVIDPSDPDVLYAAMYQRQRRTWGFNGGGPEGGIFRTTDGGDTWERLREGLPEGPLGRIGRLEDMAGIAIYLASAAGAYTNGAVIPVDGGTHLSRRGASAQTATAS